MLSSFSPYSFLLPLASSPFSPSRSCLNPLLNRFLKELAVAQAEAERNKQEAAAGDAGPSETEAVTEATDAATTAARGVKGGKAD